jgi:hypothetical protein
MQARRAAGVLMGLALAVIGCSSGGTGNGTPNGGNGATVTVTFTGPTPVAVATQVGAGSFTSVAPGNQVTLTLPSTTTKYAVAFLCPPAGSPTFNAETVVEATAQDGTSLTENCFAAPPGTGTATGNASSAIAGSTQLEVLGNGGSAFFSNPASFSLPMTVGANDVAVVALDGSSNILGVKIVRSQTVPGTVGGSGIVLTPPTDATTMQSVTLTNVPAGFNPPSTLVNYHTASGTFFGLVNSTAGPANPQPYAVVPAASNASGDFYHYFGVAVAPLPAAQSLGTAMSTTSGGGAVTLALPASWTFSGPTPAKLPAFTFNYSGFNGQAMVEDVALIVWSVGATSNQIRVTATANFQSGATTVTVPDLSSIPAFLAPAPSGTTVNWIADIFAGTPQVMTNLQNPPPNASGSFVQNAGQFTQP